MADSKIRFNPALDWRYETDWPLCDLSLAAEPAWVVTRNRLHQLELLDDTGTSRGFWSSAAPLSMARISGDGSAAVALTSAGRLHWLTGPALVERLACETYDEPFSLSIDTTGWYAAVGNRVGELMVVDRLGRVVSRFRSPAPLVDLAFARQADLLVGCSVDGFVGAFTLAGELVWQQWLPHGGRAVALGSSDRRAWVATAEPRLQSIGFDGLPRAELSLASVVQGIDISEPGDVILTWDAAGEVRLLDGEKCEDLARWKVTGALARAALDPLSRAVWLAYLDGCVERWEVQPEGRLTTAASRRRMQREPTWMMDMPSDCLVDESLNLVATDDPSRGVLIDSRGRFWVVRSRSSTRAGQLIHRHAGVGEVVGKIVARDGLVVAQSRLGLAWYDVDANASVVIESDGGEVVSCDADRAGVLMATSTGSIAHHSRSGELQWAKQLDRPAQAVCVSSQAVWCSFDDGEMYQFDPHGAPLRQFNIAMTDRRHLANLGSTLLAIDVTAGTVDGYSLAGRLVWQRPLGCRPHSWKVAGSWLVVCDEFGTTMAVNADGERQRAHMVTTTRVDYIDRAGEPGLRAAWGFERTVGVGDFAGRLDWRRECESAVAVVAIGRASVIAVVGSKLLWFSS